MKLRRVLCWMGWRSELLWTGNQGGAARGVMFEPTLCMRVSSYTHTCVGPCSTNLKLWVDSAFLGDIQEQEAIPMGSILT